MRPITIAIPASSSTVPIPLDVYQIGPIEWQIMGVSGTVSIDVEYTLDDIFAEGYNPATGNWFDSDATAQAAAAAGRLRDAGGSDINPTAVRFTNAETGTAVGRIVQSGVMG